MLVRTGVVAVLERAAERVFPVNGQSRWCRWEQVRMKRKDRGDVDVCQVCALGAICWAATGKPLTQDTVSREAARFVEDMLGRGIVEWNDYTARNGRHVSKVLKQAARYARENSL